MQIWCGLGYHDYMDVGLLAAFILILELLWLLYGGISAPLYYFRLCLCKREIFFCQINAVCRVAIPKRLAKCSKMNTEIK
jgi:hypothetical protein